VSPSILDDGSPRQGVSTLDIALIRRHILGVSNLNSPFKVLAADVNGSQSVTTLDLAYIRRLILAIDDWLPGGPWKFVRSDSEFLNPLRPWNPPTIRAIQNLPGDMMNQDFIAIKHGDVDGSWTPPVKTAIASGSVHPGAVLKSLRTPDDQANPVQSDRIVMIGIGGIKDPRGELRRVPIVARSVEDLTSLQMTIEWDPTMFQYERIESSTLEGFGTDNVGTAVTNAGKLTFSWDSPTSVGVTLEKDSKLFEVILRSKMSSTTGGAIRISDQPTIREASVNFERAELQVENENPVRGVADDQNITLRAEIIENSLALHVLSVQGKTVVIEFKPNLGDGEWIRLMSLEAVGVEQTFVDRNPVEESRFYRARIE